MWSEEVENELDDFLFVYVFNTVSLFSWNEEQRYQSVVDQCGSVSKNDIHPFAVLLQRFRLGREKGLRIHGSSCCVKACCRCVDVQASCEKCRTLSKKGDGRECHRVAHLETTCQATHPRGSVEEACGCGLSTSDELPLRRPVESLYSLFSIPRFAS